MARVLLIENDLVLRTSLRTILECAAFEVEEASTARDAARAMSKKRIDLVVTDDLFESADSSESLMTIVRKTRPRPAVILISGHGDGHRELLAQATEVHTLLTQPFDLNTVVATCCQALL